MKYSEIEKHLIFGQNLANLKLELTAFEVGSDYPEDSVKKLKNDLSNAYGMPLSIFPKKLGHNDIPQIVQLEVKKINQVAALVVELGYHIGFWWNKKSQGGEVLSELELNNEKIIKDLNKEISGVKKPINDILHMYKEIDFAQYRTYEIYSQVGKELAKFMTVGKPKELIESAVVSEVINILFLAANPIDTRILSLDEEIHAIKLELSIAELTNKFNFKPELAVRIEELSRHLLVHNPEIVHFSGHGGRTGEIIMLDASRESFPVPTDALANLFKLFKDKIRCVVLNACYSELQAEAIAQHIDYVVGMSRAIEDEAAIAFAQGFYRALGHGKKITKAFEFGKVQMMLLASSKAEEPHLIAKK